MALLVGVLAAVALGVAGVAIESLYRLNLDARRQALGGALFEQAAMTAAIARAAGDETFTLDLVRDAHAHVSGFGETAEMLIAKREGEGIRYLLAPHRDLGELSTRVSGNPSLAGPMRRALGGEIGTMVGHDYDGHQVLAAFRPATEYGWGMVIKVDLAEVRAPYRRAAWLAGGTALVLIGLGALLFTGITRPMLRRLEESATALQAAFDQAAVGLAHVGLDGRYQRANLRFCEITGYAEDELRALTFRDLTHHDDLRAQNRPDDALLRGEAGAVALETRYQRKDGSPVWVKLEVTLVRDEAGDASHYVAAIEDVTLRRQAQERITALNRLLRTIRSVNLLIGREYDRERVLEEACRILVVEGGFLGAHVAVVSNGHGGFSAASGVAVAPAGGEAALRRAQSEGVTVVVGLDAGTASGDNAPVTAEEGVVGAFAAAPVRVGGRLAGALGVAAPSPDAFDVEILGLLEEVAADLGLGLRSIELDEERERAEVEQRASEELFRTVFESSPTGMATITLDGRYERVNRAFARMLGSEPEAVEGRSILATAHPEDRDLNNVLFDELLAGRRESVQFEKRYLRADGGVVWALVSASAAREAGGAPRFVIGHAENITPRMRAEAALREAHGRLAAVIDTAPLAIFTLDRECRVTGWNPAAERIFGWPAAEVLGTFPPWVRDGDGAEFESLRRQLDEGGTVIGREVERRRKDGTPVRISLSAAPLRDGLGVVVGGIGLAQDVTAHWEAERALGESEARFRAAFEAAAVGMVLVAPDGRLLMVNDEFCSMVKRSREELLAGGWQEITHPDDVAASREVVRALLAGERASGRIEKRYLRPGGEAILADVATHLVRDDSGRPLYFITHVADITEERRAEEELRTLGAAVEQAGGPIIITDTDGTIRYVNPAFERVTGYPRAEVIGSNPRILKSGVQDESFYRAMWDTLRRGETWQGRFVNRRKDGSLYDEEASIAPVRDAGGSVVNYVATKRDVTEEELLRAQLAQAQKMEAVGRLAGGIAHDFNNLLQAMLGLAGAWKAAPEADPVEAPAAARRLAELEELIGRGAQMTRQLLLFSRREQTALRPLEVNEAVLASARLLRRLLRENVVLEVEAGPGPLRVLADAGQFDQVLMNLAVNAGDAMPDGGRLTIVTGRSGSSAVIEVRDTGHGIPETIRDRIFEPFFTTKGSARGTGLGLSVVHGIVTRHGGTIEVESKPGAGTTFRVVVPLGGQAEPTAAEPAIAPTPAPSGDGVRVLLIEDETVLRDGLAEVLGALGYDVVAVGSGEEAAALPAEPAFDVVLADLSLPGAGGQTVTARLSRRWPALRVVLMSGYPEGTLAAADMSRISGYLEKPFGMDTLAATLRSALAGGSPSSARGPSEGPDT
ncbi:MAG: PAS domain S-box protein [Acidobacteriota bacterium]